MCKRTSFFHAWQSGYSARTNDIGTIIENPEVVSQKEWAIQSDHQKVSHFCWEHKWNSLVTKPEFFDLLTTADPRYIVPGRMARSREINKVLVDLKANIGSYLQDACKVSITADMWSKKGLTSSYMGITAHFFSPRDHYRHWVMLAVRRCWLSGRYHTAKCQQFLLIMKATWLQHFVLTFRMKVKMKRRMKVRTLRRLRRFWEWRWCWFWFWWMCRFRRERGGPWTCFRMYFSLSMSKPVYSPLALCWSCITPSYFITCNQLGQRYASQRWFP